MLAESKLKALLDLVHHSSHEELLWMNGYLSGIVSRALPGEKGPGISTLAEKITIAYGTETGNSKRIATELVSKAKKKGMHVRLVSLDQYRLNDLTKEEYFFTIISTHGEGEPPPAARKFYDHIHQNGFKLDKLKYSVLALGDTAYPLFCKTGEDVDVQLQKLGGKRITALQKCDVDYDTAVNAWFEKILGSVSATVNDTVPVLPPAEKKTAGKKTYTGIVLANINLNDRGSEKATWHIEMAADGLDYVPGDSIGIVPQNALATVETIISLTGIDQHRQLVYRGEHFTIFDLLKKKVSVLHLTDGVVKKYAAIVGSEIPPGKIDLVDLLKTFPVKGHDQFEEVLSVLNPLAPRLYTVASSPAAHAGEVHITVARDVYIVNEQNRYGLCSDFLGGINENDELAFFIQKNKRFRLAAPDKDIIMIGPGTGIAPFRSFLAERDATGATGRSWLFFGEQHFTSDFLYQAEMQDWFQTGVLTKVDVAFSRDQPEKVYVQHKMLKHGAEFYDWLQGGAYLYVCGTRDPMSVSVENALLQIIEQFGEKTKEDALQYLERMNEEGRYSKDVY